MITKNKDSDISHCRKFICGSDIRAVGIYKTDESYSTYREN